MQEHLIGLKATSDALNDDFIVYCNDCHREPK